MDMWTTLHALPKGAVFETEHGIRAVKSEYRYPSGGIECVLLASGEYANFAQDVADPEASARAHNATRVRPLQVAPPPDAAALVTEAELAEVRRLDAEATPGPWRGEVENERRGWHTVRAGRMYVLPVATVTITKNGESYEESGIRIQPGDLAFITNARTTQPRLAAEVRRLTAEVAERDAQIARLAVDGAAVEAKLAIEVMTANQRAADRADTLASAEERLNTIGNIANEILLDAEDSAVPEHSDVPTRLIDALRKAVAR